jgi:hypothetical protein
MTIMADHPLVTFAVTAPARWNNAGFCRCCDERGCMSAECIASYASTLWGVCERCDGTGWFFGLDPCICADGVVEVGSDHPAAVRP